MDGLQPRSVLDPRLFVMERKNGTNNWSQEQYHAHHDSPWTHVLAPMVVHIEVLRLHTIDQGIPVPQIRDGVQEPE